ncbi:hypothetical protein SETIT_9G279000v2 [Setaria italica]|uniref:Uncharacterized protein n=1 Tax=Setaria italica TaxID=4555 RepID=A0A368SLE1_SETIT|nr:hypothetical protein SETIT_9G279000v2 [Setaria italica]
MTALIHRFPFASASFAMPHLEVPNAATTPRAGDGAVAAPALVEGEARRRQHGGGRVRWNAGRCVARGLTGSPSSRCRSRPAASVAFGRRSGIRRCWGEAGEGAVMARRSGECRCVGPGWK